MHYLALATDYDGTLAADGRVDEATLAALKRLRESGRRPILVTGRELGDLESVFPQLDLFDRIVAENGGLLYRPETREEVPLAERPPDRFAALLRDRGVAPLSVGRTIVATWEPHETTVLEAIRELGLELQIIFNKGAVMVLPPGVNKASGLMAALDELDLSPLNVVGVGDAENDHAFLHLCGCAVAVANALPMLKDEADLVTAGARSAGVAELIARLIGTDMADLDPCVERHKVLLGVDEENRDRHLRPRDTNLLVAGTSGSGKSTFTTGLLERLKERGFQVCIIDPEGDYEALENAVVLGDNHRPPGLSEALDLLSKPGCNVVVNLLGVKLDDRPEFFADLMTRLADLRVRTARPHWMVVDEAHHMLPESWDRAAEILPGAFKGLILVTVHPHRLARSVLASVDETVTIGPGADETLAAFAEAVGMAAPAGAPSELAPGEMLLWNRQGGAPLHCRVVPPRGEHQRHIRKYAEGELGDHSFYFRGPDGRLNLRVQNLMLFCQIADGVDDETWLHHLRAGDYSRWFREAIKDDGLADDAASVEAEEGLPARESRARIRDAVERRYTAPG
ncbi:MAG TPA: HAD-IIB family hydrolase [Alphaproteobacteria bacterium]|nr:HAD-IIB family hydrolase [Alphaproteobacteria bacterium]